MKKIHIVEIIPPDKTNPLSRFRLWNIFLGNDVREYFKSGELAREFLAETNRFLNFKLHELNYLYGLVFTEYRRHWFSFAAEDHTEDKELKKREQEILGMLQSTDHAFSMVVSRSHHTNGNYFTFKHLLNITDYLVAIIKILQTIDKRRKIYTEIRRLEIFRIHAQRIRESLENYAKDKPKKQPEEELISEILTIDEEDT